VRRNLSKRVSSGPVSDEYVTIVQSKIMTCLRLLGSEVQQEVQLPSNRGTAFSHMVGKVVNIPSCAPECL